MALRRSAWQTDRATLYPASDSDPVITIVPAGRPDNARINRRGRSETIITGRSSPTNPSARPPQSASSPRMSNITMSPDAGACPSGRASAAITTYPRRVNVSNSADRPSPSGPNTRICIG